MIQGFLCRICGKYHDELPLAYGAKAPYDWDVIKHEDEESCSLTDEICFINNKFFYIKGCIEIPIHDYEQSFSWDVWVSVKKENMKIQFDYWDTKNRENLVKPMFGWLSVKLPLYPSTYGLKTMIHTRKCGIRPYIELEATDHPLSIEQRTGISIEKVKETASLLLHR